MLRGRWLGAAWGALMMMMDDGGGAVEAVGAGGRLFVYSRLGKKDERVVSAQSHISPGIT